ncbi:MAG: hypothetical protein AAF292_06140 [Pseudomonadota bacterium]
MRAKPNPATGLRVIEKYSVDALPFIADNDAPLPRLCSRMSAFVPAELR